MQQNDIMSTRSAASLCPGLRWGKELKEPVRGCVVVYERVDKQGHIIPNRGHVGLWLGAERRCDAHPGWQPAQPGWRQQLHVITRSGLPLADRLPTNSTTNMASTTAAAGTVVAAAPWDRGPNLLSVVSPGGA